MNLIDIFTTTQQSNERSHSTVPVPDLASGFMGTME